MSRCLGGPHVLSRHAGIDPATNFLFTFPPILRQSPPWTHVLVSFLEKDARRYLADRLRGPHGARRDPGPTSGLDMVPEETSKILRDLFSPTINLGRSVHAKY